MRLFERAQRNRETGPYSYIVITFRNPYRIVRISCPLLCSMYDVCALQLEFRWKQEKLRVLIACVDRRNMGSCFMFLLVLLFSLKISSTDLLIQKQRGTRMLNAYLFLLVIRAMPIFFVTSYSFPSYDDNKRTYLLLSSIFGFDGVTFL